MTHCALHQLLLLFVILRQPCTTAVVRDCRVDPGGPVVIILASGSKVRRFKPGRGQWIFSERNPEYDFLQKEGKDLVPCPRFTACERTSS